MRRNMMRTFLLLSLLAACATPSATATVPPCPGPSAAIAADTVLGNVNGVPVHRRDLDPALDRELADITNEAKQRELHVLWVAVDDAITSALLESEAKRRGLTVRELRRQEIEGKMSMPTDEEVRAIYDANKDIIQATYEEAAPHIKRQLAEEQFDGIERALVERLRSAAEVRYALPVPDLPRFPVELGDADIRGNRDARVTLIEFSDFGCPYCGRASEMLKKLLALYPNDLRLVFRDFPLSQHKNAQQAAEAAQCAREQGKFWEYHDLLYANAQAFEKEDLRKYAGELALDLAAFDGCVAADRAKKIVTGHLEAGRAAGVEGTPTIYINGIKLIGLLPLPLLQTIIDGELRR
jgi:protein-disulfide isomerase